MSHILTIAAVTAVLKSLLENGMGTHGLSQGLGSDVFVTALPLDKVMVAAEEKPQINVFLYQVMPNTALRSGPLKPSSESKASPGAVPLALELYYLFTAFGGQEYQTEILLNYVMQCLHQQPMLSSNLIKSTLKASANQGSRVGAPISKSTLAEQVEEIRLAPQFLNAEELSRLWSAMQARYRPSVAYKVSVVPIMVAGGKA